MYQVLVYLVFLQISISASQDGSILFRDDNYEIGSPCQEASGTGICVLAESCRIPNKMLNNWNPQICFFQEHKTPVICCPSNLASNSGTTNSPNIINPTTKPTKPGNLGQNTSDRLTRLSTIKCQEYMQNYTNPKAGPAYYGIVLGTNAGIAEFPHMAALGMDNPSGNGLRFTCGGSLISERYILTAAHCFGREAPTMVRLGERDLSTDEDNETVRDFEIESVIIHPQYKGSTVYNDIALLRLNETVIFTRFIRPACLYSTVENEDLNVIATGWGHTEFGGVESAILQKVDLQIFTTEQCTPNFQPTRRLPQGLVTTQLCAGSNIDARDTCQGDSGGPLSISTYNLTVSAKIYYIVGLTSFGKSCGAKIPAIYTRVASYMDWIEGIAWS